jgi:hypothetical protein
MSFSTATKAMRFLHWSMEQNTTKPCYVNLSAPLPSSAAFQLNQWVIKMARWHQRDTPRWQGGRNQDGTKMDNPLILLEGGKMARKNREKGLEVNRRRAILLAMRY